MLKKRWNRSAQITIFIILGILLLFGAIFVMTISSEVKTGQLQQQEEQAMSKVFKKESLRLYVEDCLQDELEKGLVALGMQGRIWYGQPGGKKQFVEGNNGQILDNMQVAYALTKGEYAYPNAYPCHNDTNQTPEFCMYTHEDTSPYFGTLNLYKSTLEEDLKAYLINRTIWCVENYTKTNLSTSTAIDPEQLKMELEIVGDGINVKAEYPLKLKVGNEEMFRISTFDFFYPSKFEPFIVAAISYPLQKDYNNLFFNYSQDFLSSPEYGHYGNYNDLGVQLQKTPQENGDDLFTFSTFQNVILNTPAAYTFRFLRQNRPPALDYVGRYACPSAGYDYLIVKDDSDLGALNATLFAADPDEDKTTLMVKSTAPFTAQVQNNVLVKSKSELASLAPNIYTLTVNATDEHGLSDWQDVRILLDTPIDTGLNLILPYSDVVSFVNSSSVYYTLASAEDPAYLNFTFPGKSKAQSTASVKLSYSNAEQTESFSVDLGSPSSTAMSKCVALPSKTNSAADSTCSLDKYAAANLSKWSKEWLIDPQFGHFKALTATGKFNLSVDINYCGGLNKSKALTAPVWVVQCVPHQNPQHPFAYPYQGYLFTNYSFDLNSGNFTGTKNDKINPLEATHSCCVGFGDKPLGWRLATPKDDPCFVNPEPRCFGKVKEIAGSTANSGYLLEQEVQYCDGTRGNVCGGSKNYSLYQKTYVCGSSAQGCTKASSECAGKFAFSAIKGKGWCWGKMGCEFVAASTIVYLGPTSLGFTPLPETYIANLARDGKFNSSTDTNFPFQKGCIGKSATSSGYSGPGSTVGKPCDNNNDGAFEGKCSDSGVCV